MSGIDSMLWVLAFVLAIVLLVVGIVLLRDNPEGKKRMSWPENLPHGTAVTLGAALIVGALCLVVPPLIAGLAWLTPVAAIVLALGMLAIVRSYYVRRDGEGAAIYIFLIVMLAALAFGRWPALAALLG